jgi:hypothetical protein
MRPDDEGLVPDTGGGVRAGSLHWNDGPAEFRTCAPRVTQPAALAAEIPGGIASDSGQAQSDKVGS